MSIPATKKGRLDMTQDIVNNNQLLTLTADIVSSHVANNTVAVSDLPAVIQNVFSTLSTLGSSEAPVDVKQEPAVSIRASVKPDYIVCLEDGKKLKMLKRHLMRHYSLTPDEYRRKWNLPVDYPMVAPNYAEARRNMAISIGLGRKPGATVAKSNGAAETPAAKRAGRKSAAKA